MSTITIHDINRLAGGRIGTHDIACPLCGPQHSIRGRQRRVLRVWVIEPGFATFCCARCGETGYAHDRHAPAPDPAKLARLRAEAVEHDRAHKAERLNKARWLWSRRRPIAGSIAGTYLRKKRGIRCPLPATLGFLPAYRDYPPAMIAAFGLAHEVEPGIVGISDGDIIGVHLTRLLPDGSDRERGDQAKIMIGHSTGWPIVLAPINDLLGLMVAEGIESALSAHEATGLGTWAAGCASRLPALADRIPNFIECVTIVTDDDADGRRHAAELAERIAAQGIEARLTNPTGWRSAA
jgi:Toprim domain